MKKLLFLVLFCTLLNISAQSIAKDTLKYDYIGLAIDSTLYAGDKTYFNQLFDKKTILNKVIVDSDDKSVKEFNRGFRDGIMNNFDLAAQLIADTDDNGSYDFLRSRINTIGEYHLLFRASGDKGLNYHDYKIEEIDGIVKIVDVYIFMSGEYLSKSIENIYKSLLSRIPGSISKLFGNSMVQDMMKVNDIKTKTAEGDYQGAYEIYESISDEMKKQKTIQIIGLQLSSNLDESIYQKVIQNYEKNFPNDPSLYLVSLDGEYLRGNYEKVLILIRKLDSAIGGDAFLDSYRTNAYFEMGDLDSALKYSNRMLDNYPLYFDAHTTRIAVLSERKEFEAAVEGLKKLYLTFGLTKETMKEAIAVDFPNLVKSKNYQDFLNEK